MFKRVIRNKNLMACFTGQTGSGKSYGSLTLSEDAERMFNVDFSLDNIVFNVSELMKLINSGELKKGSPIVFDEAGISYGAREWQSVGNKMLNYLIQTFRHRNYIMCFTMPYFSFIDVQARKLFHMRFETQFIDYRRKLLHTKPFLLEVSQDTGKIYRKYLRVPIHGKLTYDKVESARFRLPRIHNKYEIKRKKYTDELNKEIQDTLDEVQDRKQLTEKQAVVYGMRLCGWSNSKISEKLGVTVEAIGKHLRLMKRKNLKIFSEENLMKNVPNK